jgi:hypothetical protein
MISTRNVDKLVDKRWEIRAQPRIDTVFYKLHIWKAKINMHKIKHLAMHLFPQERGCEEKSYKVLQQGISRQN